MKAKLEEWVVEALKSNKGSSTIVQVSEFIWKNHKDELKKMKSLFYTWQYDVRWAAHALRKKGIMKDVSSSKRGEWELAD